MSSENDNVELDLGANPPPTEEAKSEEAPLEAVQQDGDDEVLDMSELAMTPQASAARFSAPDVAKTGGVCFGADVKGGDGGTDVGGSTTSQRSHTLPARRIVRQKSVRKGQKDHVQQLARNRRASMFYMEQNLGLKKGQLTHSPDSFALHDEDSVKALDTDTLSDEEKAKILANTKFMKAIFEMQKRFTEAGIKTNEGARAVEVRMNGMSYVVPVDADGAAVHDIINSTQVYKIYKRARRIRVKNDENRRLRLTRKFSVGHVHRAKEKSILTDVDLCLRPGHSYLILGPPGSGKTTLLKAISSLLPVWKNGPQLKGSTSYNGLPFNNDHDVVLGNVIAFIDQIDRHAPRLSVKETFDFAFQCKGGTHRTPIMEGDESKIAEMVGEQDNNDARVNFTMEGLGLDHVQDTFVGSSEVRGVSGGQRRRVTVGEMLMWAAPVLCGDEISTGLDAASTYDICSILNQMAKIYNLTRVVSLLQPSPETVALFDEVIILSEGYVIFAGPILDAVPYFHDQGYDVPDHMDDADFLQALATPDGKDFYRGEGKCPDAATKSILFKESAHGERIRERLKEPLTYDWTQGACFSCNKHIDDSVVKPDDVEKGGGGTDHDELQGTLHNKGMISISTSEKGTKLYAEVYSVTFTKATLLNCARFFTLWKRDIRFVRANFIKNLVMGISVGVVFVQTTIVESLLGVMFQSMLFIMLGAMTAAPAQVEERAVYYKHYDANLYPTFSFVLGRTLAMLPQALMDVTTFGVIIYFVVGLELAAKSFFIFYSILLTFTVVMSTMLSACVAFSPSSSTVQALSAVIILFNMLFCGFFVAPNTIPAYYAWIYWICPLAWAFRGLVCNEFLSESYSNIVPGTGMTQGEQILKTTGFTYNGEAFTRAWIGYGFYYMLAYIVFMICLNAFALQYIRFESGKSGGGQETVTEESDKMEDEEKEDFDLPFQPIDLTFKDVCYEVKASTGNEVLKLLSEVNGRLQPGRMCALMGSSGAGKTTLMDVIALRKTSGTITGEVRLNGHLQEEATFRRCSGYVEQFDVQTPELTVRETILFSAKLRLDTRNEPLLADQENVVKFVDQVIDMMELASLDNLLVGDDESGGLSFEQRKRLSIAVELAASPSVIFLDEPTSGLDSRAALIVVKSLQKIASTGRTVCATIHQPSSAVFEMFDDLLLMKKGGRVTYCGPLGKVSASMCEYFESHGGEPINRGENPATWMLNVITKEPAKDEEEVDYAQIYLESDERTALVAEIDGVTGDVKDEDKITYEHIYAASVRTRHRLMRHRLQLIYWRSPSYNRGRIVLSLLIAFLLASVFLSNRRPEVMTEQEISGVFSTIFLSFIIVGILSLTSVLPVMVKIRDVFYRHRAAGMMNHASLTLALASAEQPFIIISSSCFVAVFYFTIGLEKDGLKFLAFWGFFTFNVAINSYFGQSFMCLVRGVATAGILCSVLIGMNNFFSGLIVRPQYLSGFWQIPYWITPGRYVYEGLMASQFFDDNRIVIAEEGSNFYDYLDCGNTTAWPPDGVACEGAVYEYFNVFFGFRFKRSNIPINGGVLGGILIIARVLTAIALKKLNYTSS